MGRIKMVLFRDSGGKIPFLEWFEALDAKVQDKCRIRLERLLELGHELRRPEADLLRNGIYELRIKHRGVNYRILYFFHRSEVAVVSHGLTKQQAMVPAADIDRALERRLSFHGNPELHTHGEMI
jgi:phage-related protein